MITGGPWRVRRDVRENGKNKLVREFENCESEMENVSIRSKETMRRLVLRLVWGAGDPKDLDSGTTAGYSFLPTPYASLVKNVEVFSRQRSMIPRHKSRRPRWEEREGVDGVGTRMNTSERRLSTISAHGPISRFFPRSIPFCSLKAPSRSRFATHGHL